MTQNINIRITTIERKKINLSRIIMISMVLCILNLIVTMKTGNSSVKLHADIDTKLLANNQPVTVVSYDSPIEPPVFDDTYYNEDVIDGDMDIIDNTDDVIDTPIIEDIIIEIPSVTEFDISTDINTPSGMSVGDIQNILSDKPHLQKYAESFYNMEQKHNVNALLAIAVSSQESGFGTSLSAQYKNNLFGIMKGSSTRYFSSVDACIDDFGRMINDVYISRGLTSIGKIAPVYCPPTYGSWANAVLWFMNSYGSSINTL